MRLIQPSLHTHEKLGSAEELHAEFVSPMTRLLLGIAFLALLAGTTATSNKLHAAMSAPLPSPLSAEAPGCSRSAAALDNGHQGSQWIVMP